MTEQKRSDYFDNESAYAAYRGERRRHWDEVARDWTKSRSMGGGYRKRIIEVCRHIVPPNSSVLEFGCGQGDLLAGLAPGRGVGVDFSPRMLDLARERHPDLEFLQGDERNLNLDETFDFIILSDVINDLWDVQAFFRVIKRAAGPHTRIVLNFFNRLWEKPLEAARALGLATPNLPQNWFSPKDVANLLELENFEVIRGFEEILWPLETPLASGLANRFLAKLWPANLLALTHFLVARIKPEESEALSVSVVVPARNEAGNIADIFRRAPDMGAETELIFVEGHSDDGTYEAIEAAMEAFPERKSSLYRQTGRGKGDAVRLGFSKASGEVLMILDADMTVAPEDLPRFYEALASGKAEFVNGVRLVYPMEKRAMRFFNLLGNKFFSLAFSWLLGQPVKDSLCGTKVLTRSNYEMIRENRSYFGEFDPFGDFDLLFGAAKLNLKIVDLPIRYRERAYGDTNIQRWKHGWVLLKMVCFAANKIKFI